MFLSAGYYVCGWADIATAFASAINDNDFAGIEAMYPAPGGAGADNNYAMHPATQCTDVQWPLS